MKIRLLLLLTLCINAAEYSIIHKYGQYYEVGGESYQDMKIGDSLKEGHYNFLNMDSLKIIEFVSYYKLKQYCVFTTNDSIVVKEWVDPNSRQTFRIDNDSWTALPNSLKEAVSLSQLLDRSKGKEVKQINRLEFLDSLTSAIPMDAKPVLPGLDSISIIPARILTVVSIKLREVNSHSLAKNFALPKKALRIFNEIVEVESCGNSLRKRLDFRVSIHLKGVLIGLDKIGAFYSKNGVICQLASNQSLQSFWNSLPKEASDYYFYGK